MVSLWETTPAAAVCSTPGFSLEDAGPKWQHSPHQLPFWVVLLVPETEKTPLAGQSRRTQCSCPLSLLT